MREDDIGNDRSNNATGSNAPKTPHGTHRGITRRRFTSRCSSKPNRSGRRLVEFECLMQGAHGEFHIFLVHHNRGLYF